MSDLLSLAEARAQMSLDEFSHDAVAELLELRDAAKQRLKAASDLIDVNVLAWCEAHGEIVRGTKRTYATDKKRVKCKNVPAALRELLIQSGGDESVMMDCLSSNAICYGEAKKVLGPELFAQHFETKIERGLDEKPVRTLATVDSRFV